MDRIKLGNQPPPPQQQATPGTWVMGTPVAPYGASPANRHAAGWIPVDRVPSPYAGSSAGRYPSNSNNYPAVAVPDRSNANGGNPYVNVSPVPSKSPTETILKGLERCGKRLEDNTRKAAGIAGNVWHHLKTGSSVTDAALARLGQGTKVFAEGGNDKVFQQTFGIFPGEQLWKAYACYLSTSAGPVIGTLYLSTARLAFCRDHPLCHNYSDAQQEWEYYKVVVPLDQLRAINPSANTMNPSEKYIQVITRDNHEFWFMGFISYEKALRNLREALQFSPHGSNQRNF